MNRDFLEAVVLERSLRRVVGSDASPIVERALASQEAPAASKMVCARLSIDLDARIESVAKSLDMTKRRFIEAALASAVTRAEQIMRDEGVGEEDEAGVRIVEAA